MNSTSMKEMLKLARGKVKYMPESVYRFIDLFLPKLSECPTAEEISGAISSSIADIGNNNVHGVQTAAYFDTNKAEVLENAKFVLQVIDDLVENAKFLSHESENPELDSLVDEIRSRCATELNWEPIRRAKVHDRILLRAIYDPNIVTAVEWWTTQIQLSNRQHGELDVARYSEEEIFRIRDELASSIKASLAQNGFVILTTRGGPDPALRDIFTKYAVVLSDIIVNVTMCVLSDKVAVQIGDFSDYTEIYSSTE